MSAPILFAVAPPGTAFAADADFGDASALMEALHNDERLWSYYSRNLWLLCAHDLARSIGSNGLAFTRRRCVALSGDELAAAAQTLSRTISGLLDGSAPLKALDPARAACLASDPARPESFKPLSEGDDGGDVSPARSAQTFYAYLGSMKHVADQAVRSKRPFFWACPQDF